MISEDFYVDVDDLENPSRLKFNEKEIRWFLRIFLNEKSTYEFTSSPAVARQTDWFRGQHVNAASWSWPNSRQLSSACS